MKTFIKPLIPLIFLGMLVGCKNENELTIEEEPTTRMEIIDPLADPVLMGIIHDLGAVSSSNGRVQEFDIVEVDFSEAIMSINEIQDITRYSLRLTNNTPLAYENIIFKEEDGESSAYIMSYYPDLNWVYRNGGQIAGENFTGILEISELDKSLIARVRFENGEGFETADSPAANGRSEGDCDDRVADDDFTDGDIPDLPDSGGGGGSWDPGNCWWHLHETAGVLGIMIHCNGEPAVWRRVRTECEPIQIPDTQDPDGGTSIGVLSGSGDSEEEALNLLEALKDRWEEGITLSENFQNDECLMSIWQAALDTDAAYDMLSTFFDGHPGQNLTLHMESDPQVLWDVYKIFESNNYGFTKYVYQDVYVVANFHNIGDASSTFISLILAHEFIHANMWNQIYNELTLHSDLTYDYNELNKTFPELYNDWVSNGLGYASHEFVAKYRESIIDFMKTMDMQLHGSLQPESKYELLSWIGLHETDEYQEAIASGAIDINVLNAIRNNELQAGRCN